MLVCLGTAISALKNFRNLKAPESWLGIAITTSEMSMSDFKVTIHLFCKCLHKLYALLYMQEPRKSATDANGKAHIPKEGRGQRQRRKKREGAGPDGQPGQPSAPSRPGKTSAGTRHANAAAHDAAADVRPAKKSHLTTDPAGTNALHPAYSGITSMHMQGYSLSGVACHVRPPQHSGYAAVQTGLQMTEIERSYLISSELLQFG